MTSSASASSVGGMSRPSSLAAAIRERALSGPGTVAAGHAGGEVRVRYQFANRKGSRT
jgi:hypothetical protein